MREIKFRAWNGKYMIDSAFGDFVSFDGVAYTEPDKRYNTPNIEITKAKDYIIMQFANEYYSDGGEVYEGDIYEYDYEYDSDYDGDMPIVKRSTGKGTVKTIFDTWQITQAKKEGGTVKAIGNIYQYPELLKP